MTRSMLRSKGVPLKYWAEAVRTAVYILNRSPMKSLPNKTPYQAWSGKVPSVQHMRVFGCIGYVKTVAPHQKKLEDRSRRMVQIGYEAGTKAYRLLDPVRKKVVVSRDVVFQETEQWKWNDQCNTPKMSKGGELRIELDQDRTMMTRREAEEIQTVNSPSWTEEAPFEPLNWGQDGFPSNENEAESTVGTNEHEVDQSPVTGTTVSGASSSSEQPKKYRSLRDVYAETHPLEPHQYEHLYFLSVAEPATFEEANTNENWKRAMVDEIDSIRRNGTWELSDMPKGKKAIDLKWVFKLKRDTEGKIVKHKARLVAKGYV